MITANVMLPANETSKTAGGTGTMITSTLATRLTGRIRSCQRASAVLPVFAATPVAILDSGGFVRDSFRRPKRHARPPRDKPDSGKSRLRKAFRQGAEKYRNRPGMSRARHERKRRLPVN